MTSVLVIGAGIAGIASACFLTRRRERREVVIVDRGAPLGLTSAVSGENYRTWWPQPSLAALAARSIEIVEAIARKTRNRPHLTRLGYVYATRSADVDGFVSAQLARYSHLRDRVRVHDGARNTYRFARDAAWEDAPDGVDLVTDRATIRRHFPDWDRRVTGFVHVRRAGDFSAQQLGDHLLREARGHGARLERGYVLEIEPTGSGFAAHLDDGRTLETEQVLLAAGPFTRHLASQLGAQLPLECVYQQKIAFEDRAGALARDTPFTIDLDPQLLDWTDDERAALGESPDLRWLVETLPGGVHRRPDGGRDGSWVKLGWAYSRTATSPRWDPAPDAHFREVVLRGAARLHPALAVYYGRLPRALSHYGGYYTRTRENLPLIGPTSVAGLHVVGGLSGYGTMCACAAGELAAAWLDDARLPDHARALAPTRYDDEALMRTLRGVADGEL